MIKLSYNCFISQDHNQTRDIINIQSLEERLHLALKDSGYFNIDLFQDVLSIVRDYASSHKEQELLTLEKLENLIFRVLSSSGLGGVARKFGDSGARSLMCTDNEFVNPDQRFVEQMLNNNPFFSDKPIEEISDLLISKLSLLGFEKITDKLIIALAESICSNLQISGPQEVNKILYCNSTTSVLLQHAFLPLLDDNEECLITKGIIAIKPISLLLPVIKIEVILSRIDDNSDQPFLVELGFYPAFNEICAQLKTIVIKLSAYIQKMKLSMTNNRDTIEILFRTGSTRVNGNKSLSAVRVNCPQLSELKEIAAYHFNPDSLARVFFL